MFRIFLEPAVPFQLDDTEYGLPKDAAVHFGSSKFAINKNNRYFCNMETAFVSSKFHFNLESIPFEADIVQVDGFKYFTAVTYKAGSGVMNG